MSNKDEVANLIVIIQSNLLEKTKQHQQLIKDILAAGDRICQAQQAEFILKKQSDAMGHEIDGMLKKLKAAMVEYAQILIVEESEIGEDIKTCNTN